MRKNIKFVILQAAFFSLFCMSYVFVNPILNERNFSISEIGFVFTLSSFIAILSQPLTAKIMNQFKSISNRKVLIFYMILSLICTVSYTFSTSWFSLFILMTLQVSSLLTVQTFIYTFILEYINRGIDINFGLTRGGGSVSFAITSLVVGIVAKSYGFSFISILNIFLELFIVFFLFTFKEHKDLGENIPIKKKNIFEFARKYKKFIYFLLGIFLILTTHSAISTFLVNVATKLHKDSSFVGFLFFVSAMLELPVMGLYSKISKKIKNHALLIFSVIFFTVKPFTMFIGLLLNMPLFILLAQIMQMFGFALYIPSCIYYINKIMEKEDKITGQAYLGVAGTLGSILSGYLGANLIEYIGVKYMMLAFSIISFIGTIIVIFSIQGGNNND